jgi:hypothetical protein
MPRVPKEDRARIRRGIAAYEPEIQSLLRILRYAGELSANAFDRHYEQLGKIRATAEQKARLGYAQDASVTIPIYRIRSRFDVFTPLGRSDDETFVLGDLSGNPWAWWLDLLQQLMRLGYVRTFRRDGTLYYALTAAGRKRIRRIGTNRSPVLVLP